MGRLGRRLVFSEPLVRFPQVLVGHWRIHQCVNEDLPLLLGELPDGLFGMQRASHKIGYGPALNAPGAIYGRFLIRRNPRSAALKPSALSMHT
jgi:hypothetical protein